MNYRILLLEENPRTVRLVRTLCEMNGYEMTVLSDLTKLEKTLALVKPHLVIMNLNWQNHFTYQPLKRWSKQRNYLFSSFHVSKMMDR